MAATRIVRTFASGNQKKWTMSFWMKVSRINYTDGGSGTSRQIFGQTLLGSASNYCRFMITGSTQKIQFYESQGMNLIPSRVFRDFNAWYHIVVAIDTAQATAANRVKIYVNGEQLTTFDTETYPAQNADLNFNLSGTHEFGSSSAFGGYDYFDGLLSHVHFSDGYAYAASDFGSTDATTGEWKINTSPSFILGTNGFTILKDGNTITDQSSNSNDFTVSTGTLTKTEDNPSNVFATIDLLSTHASNYTFANGNNKVTNSNPSTRIIRSTLGASSGKYYFETKIATVGGSGGFGTGLYVGVTDADYFEQLGLSQAFIGTGSNQVAQRGDGSHLAKNNTQINGYESCSAGSILQVALDLDNGYVYFGVNGTWGNSGDPTSGATGTGGVSITTGKTYMFAASGYNGWSVETNFGNGYFGTTAVSSAGTNASNLGIFEYDVPSGYTALCTKGLNE